MIVLLVSVMSGLAALARGLGFTFAASLVLLGSVFVLYGTLTVAGAVVGSTLVQTALALVMFVLVIGVPVHFLASRKPSPRDDRPPDGGPSGGDADRADDASTIDPEAPGETEPDGDEEPGRTSGS